MADPDSDPTDDVADPSAEVLAAAFPDRDVRVVRRLEGRATNGVYELVVGGDEPVGSDDRVVLKLTDRAGWRLAKEAAILRELAPVGDLPVPEVLARGRAGATDYLATAFCEGAVASEAVPPTGDDAREFLAGLGRTLARVHDAVGFDRPGNPVAGDDGGIRVDGAGDWVGVLGGLLDAEARILEGTPFERSADRARSLLAEYGDRVADPPGIRLLHSDPNPDNVFVEDGAISCVIDWEYATAGDPAWDICSAEWSCTGKSQFDPADADAILAGYRAVRSIPEGFDRRRTLYRALLPVGTMVALAGGSEAERGSVAAPGERVRRLRERFEERVAAVEEA